MNDFLKELFETYYKEQKRQDKINLLENEIEFLSTILDEGISFQNLGILRNLLNQKESELKKLKEGKSNESDFN